MKTIIRKIITPELVKYGIIGMAGTVLHTGVIAIGVEIWDLSPVLSSFFGFFLSLLLSYALNSIWTFRSRFDLLLFWKYAIVCTAGLLLNLSIIYLFNNILGLWYLIGQFVAIVIVPVFNFMLNKLWVFYRSENQEAIR